MRRCRPLDQDELKRHPLPPVVAGDKNSHGKLLVIAGTREIAGAASICANAALRAGAGKITIATVASVAPLLAMAIPEARVVAVTETREGGFAHSATATLGDLANEYDAVVAGPGMSPTKVATGLAAKLCAIGRPLVLDAALLHGLAPAAEHARAAHISPILLPHSGEMASLIGCSPEDVEAEPLDCGHEAARRYDALVLVKGPESHIVTPGGDSWKYRGGGPGLGISGSGDTLAGVLGGLLARGAGPLEALLWSVWLHGEAGASLATKIGPIGFFAREIASEVPALLARAQPSLE
jgi:hydroxyethylthiazole kinase-like uncharacterized protein yjeF